MSTLKNGFSLHTKETAPEASRPMLEQVEKNFGFVLNIFGVMAESPAATEAYLTLTKLMQEKTALSPVEQQVVLLTISEHNRCDYCVAAHTMSAERTKVDPGVLEALRSGSRLPDAKLDALATYTRTAMDKKGWVDESDVQAFLDAGYTRQQLMDIYVVLSLKTISNYVNHIADTPLDGPLQSKALKKAS
jgi:uncharacterized peroxidase-related enzyme